ncbi:MAG: OmpA family protein [Robiginitomaculum sp.]|nr:OmpA family protein [Robiginitomaculum sp.]
MGTFSKWLIGLILLAFAALIIEFTPWGAKANSVAMGNSVSSALKNNGFGNIATDMVGNVAKLSGDVASASAKETVLSTARNAQCEKCTNRDAGKRWHEVDGSAVKIVNIAKPYTLTGVRTENGGIVLNGYARNEADRLAILADAERLFPGNVSDNKIKIAQGAPDASWNATALTNMAGLAQLDSGEFTMTDWNSVLTGMTSSGDVREGVNASIAGLESSYNGAANIAVPNLAAVNTGEIKSEDICQALFDKLKGDNKISFAYNRAEIRQGPSTSLLNSLASAAMQCSSFHVTIEGHTDADGSEDYNLQLSRRRAEAVLNYLVQNGVDEANISGGGYGESRPIASNDTAAGMAANRRIEFKVTRSK